MAPNGDRGRWQASNRQSPPTGSDRGSSTEERISPCSRSTSRRPPLGLPCSAPNTRAARRGMRSAPPIWPPSSRKSRRALRPSSIGRASPYFTESSNSSSDAWWPISVPTKTLAAAQFSRSTCAMKWDLSEEARWQVLGRRQRHDARSKRRPVHERRARRLRRQPNPRGPHRAGPAVNEAARPGIPNLDQILFGKYRSMTGLGKGLLGAMQLCHRFDIDSDATGTRIGAEMRF
jgi:hypothetical protein